MKKILIVFICLCFLLFADACGTSDQWPERGLARSIPIPEGSITIDTDSEEIFRANIRNKTDSCFKSYIDQSRSFGFIIDSAETERQYRAFNSEGMELQIECTEKGFTVTLHAPRVLHSFIWPTAAERVGLPSIGSEFGEIDWENGNSFYLYVGDVTKDSFTKYIDKCKEAGFKYGISQYDDYFEAENADEYILCLQYEGYNTVYISLEEPAKMKGEATTVNSPEIITSETEVDTQEESTRETTDPEENATSELQITVFAEVTCRDNTAEEVVNRYNSMVPDCKITKSNILEEETGAGTLTTILLDEVKILVGYTDGEAHFSIISNKLSDDCAIESFWKEIEFPLKAIFTWWTDEKTQDLIVALNEDKMFVSGGYVFSYVEFEERKDLFHSLYISRDW